jgi:YHS domain-containing protein
MFRAIFDLIVVSGLILLARAVLRIVLKGFAEAMNPNAGRPGAPGSSQVPLTGELKKDPSCGTYISAATSIKEQVGGETLHFCSKACRDKYVASLAR